MPARVKVKDRGWNRAQRALRKLNGYTTTIGIHGDAAAHPGPVDNIQLGVIHEFGASFMHPGGTPYMVSWGGGGRSGGFVGGQVVFLPKGDPRAIGVTRAHRITIPERSFLRSAFDKGRKRYERLLRKQAGLVIDGKQAPEKAIGIVGEKALADVVNGINRGIPPPNKPATIRRKGRSKPLIDSGQLKMSIKVKVIKE